MTIRPTIGVLVTKWEVALAEGDADAPEPPYCQAGKDGDCIWEDCPQLRDNEPSRSGRHCPLDTETDDEDADHD